MSSPTARRRCHPAPAGLAALTAVLLAAALAGALTGCGGEAPAGLAEQPAQSVILISIDTLRPDHLGCYGHDLPTSPNIDSFRRDAVLFEEAIASAPSTLSSHASLFTSLVPQHHRASYAQRLPLAPEAVTVAEAFSGAGFATAAFTGGGQLDPVFGVDQGFDRYESSAEPFSKVVDRALAWLDRPDAGEGEGEAEGDDRFFLFLHTYEVHHPYRPRPRHLAALNAEPYSGPLPADIEVELLERINSRQLTVSPEDLAHIELAYDAEIRSMDAAFGRLIAGLRERGLYDRVAIAFTSDHGEEFGEHGWIGWHSHSLYDELLRVPLLIKPAASPRTDGATDGATDWATDGANPGPGRSIDQQVRLIDVAPTLLALAGLVSPDQFAGENLLPLIPGTDAGEADPPPRPAVAARDMERDRKLEAVRFDGWKWVDGQLFDLGHDPVEQVDLRGKHPTIARGLERRLESYLASRNGLEGAVPVEPEDATQRRLEALGYVD